MVCDRPSNVIVINKHELLVVSSLAIVTKYLSRWFAAASECEK